MLKSHKVLVCCFLVLFFYSDILFASDFGKHELRYQALVSKFYAAINQRLFWFGNAPESTVLRGVLLQKLDSAENVGIERNEQLVSLLQEISNNIEKAKGDSATVMKSDMLFTDAAISYCKDLYQGSGIDKWMAFDEWSKKYEEQDNNYVISHLSSINSAMGLAAFFDTLEPKSKEYLAFRDELSAQTVLNNASKRNLSASYLNFHRWIHHFNFEKFIVVNVGSATLRYYEHDTQVLYSRMVVGKPTTKTPRFAAKCTQVILYPYWNVPQDIAMRELVPKYKKRPHLLETDNMQVVDAKGVVVNPYLLDWAKFGRGYFPYRLRQSTGCDNSLGVIKFDLDSPFDVYLHDTNSKGLFSAKNRYRSHGCMRVEKAAELGNYLLNNKLDTTFLQACIKGEKPVTMPLEKPVPVFVVYLTCAPDENGTITYFDDIYHLLKSK